MEDATAERGQIPMRKVVEILRCEVLWGEELLDSLLVRACFAADLMSDVLAYSDPGAVLITGLTTVQSIHTANVADLSAILFVGGKRPAPDVYAMAEEKRIPVLVTPLSMQEACNALRRNGMSAESRP
ncbi:MAG: transcriptional regulator [Candidatus Eisenbacteria bacterium]|nr:transcriptional regulator [Candidatus Latescibacterota bacterium]MBD3302810.1 transcriptional regulator [Candidatus Eisenbacteria bacterium]